MARGGNKGKRRTIHDPVGGKQYIFTPRTVSVIRAWPLPTAWKKGGRVAGWHPFRPKIDIPREDLTARIEWLSGPPIDDEGQLYFPFDMFEKPRYASWMYLRWIDRIPLDIRKVVGAFNDRRWHLLSLIARCGNPALDLAIANPALAYALASNWVFHQPRVAQPMRSARALLKPGKKQVEIMEWLGFPATESARKMLAKILPKSIYMIPLLRFRTMMKNSELIGRFRHLPFINGYVLRMAMSQRFMSVAGTGLLLEMLKDHRKAQFNSFTIWQLVKDTLAMHELLRQNAGPLPVMADYPNLLRVHNDYTREIMDQKDESNDIPLPPPPIQGTDNIVPLVTVSQLRAEGREQKNCVGSYAKRVLVHRNIYIYRVVKPERCTLSVDLKDGKWRIDQLYQSCNRIPSPDTRAEIVKWLGSNRPG